MPSTRWLAAQEAGNAPDMLTLLLIILVVLLITGGIGYGRNR